MRITILNGDMQDDNSAFSIYVEQLQEQLSKLHNVDVFNLKAMELSYCSGCWTCWTKTPGECCSKDDAELVFSSTINSDLLIFASPLILGFTSSLLKKITDRLIVLLHPYIQLINDESHHRKRYPSYPKLALLLEKESDTDNEDIKIIKDIYDRLAINFHSEMAFMKFTHDQNMEDLADEISHI